MTHAGEKKRIGEIEQREKKATPGQWGFVSHHEIFRNDIALRKAVETRRWSLAIRDDGVFHPEPTFKSDDIDFISESRQDIPFLLSMVKSLEEKVELMKKITEAAGERRRPDAEREALTWVRHIAQHPMDCKTDGTYCECGLRQIRAGLDGQKEKG